MNETKVLTVGSEVPNFELEVYNPAEREFGKVSLATLKQEGKWTVLVFTRLCPPDGTG